MNRSKLLPLAFLLLLAALGVKENTACANIAPPTPEQMATSAYIDAMVAAERLNDAMIDLLYVIEELYSLRLEMYLSGYPMGDPAVANAADMTTYTAISNGNIFIAQLFFNPAVNAANQGDWLAATSGFNSSIGGFNTRKVAADDTRATFAATIELEVVAWYAWLELEDLEE